MKHKNRLIITLLCLLAQALVANDPYKIIIEPRWQDLDAYHGAAKLSMLDDSKWILIGSITFEKRAKEPVTMHRLHLEWVGAEKLKQLTASLYRKQPDKDFYPLESNLVCDGVWCANKQTVIFTFNEEKTLGPRTTFYFVVTIAPDQEDILKKGRFRLLKHALPESFQSMPNDENLCLSLDAINSVTTVIESKNAPAQSNKH